MLRTLLRRGHAPPRRMLSTAPPPPPPSLGTRALDLFAARPSLFFGPLLGSLFLWALRSNRGSASQDAVVRGVDEASPLHAREVAALGKGNALTEAEWRAASAAVLRAVGARLEAAAAGGRLSGARFHAVCSVRPSEVEAALAMATGGRALVHRHMLRRAAAWLALRESGAVDFPHSAADARAATTAAEVARTPPDIASQGLLVQAAHAWRAITGISHDDVDGSGSASTPLAVGAAWGDVLPAIGPFLQHGEDDAPLPLLLALSLYGTVMAGRDEPRTPEAPDVAAAATMPSPSRRLALWVDLLRSHAALQARFSEAIDESVCGIPRPWLLECHDDAPALVAAANELMRSANVPGSSTPASPTSPAYTLSELRALLSLLGETFQLPTRARTCIDVSTPQWPFPVYALCADAASALNTAITDAKVDLKVTPEWPLRTPPPPPPPPPPAADAVGAAAPPTASPAVTPEVPKPVPLPGGPSPRTWLSSDEARRVTLLLHGTCAWGECYARDR